MVISVDFTAAEPLGQASPAGPEAAHHQGPRNVGHGVAEDGECVRVIAGNQHFRPGRIGHMGERRENGFGHALALALGPVRLDFEIGGNTERGQNLESLA